ncbi:hypothetical protein [Rugamonas aquatica]|uniref:Uncharacterized protein n=1 Tax=Rugamonas aquatica TaxID=2743357 RepID=A0A6A7N9Q9_9BURK|nr:hypothetical protein [Rugamonas aquatica]MQA41592.1 hypothetical protein [Rugamonas aquatica]
MLISKNSTNSFATDFSKYEKVGFHCTSIVAAPKIESAGFLPAKVFEEAVHVAVVAAIKTSQIAAGAYFGWLGMKSISFGGSLASARAQIHSSGGQGLNGMCEALTALLTNGSDEHAQMAQHLLNEIAEILKSPVVIYAVDLSGLGPRLARQGEDYQVYFREDEPLPTMSLVGPSRLIERLELT